MNRLEQIKSRLNEIREMVDNDEKRGDKTFSELEKEVDELQAEKRMLERSGYRELGDYTPQGVITSQDQDEYRNYLITRELPSGITKQNGFVPVPTEEVQEIKKLKDSILQLKNLVNVRPVTHGEGTIPIVRPNPEPMAKVAELEKNPQLAVTPYSLVNYKIDTYRTSAPVSNELLEDADVDVQKEVREFFAKLSTATENNQILDVILNGDGEQTFQTLTATDSDSVKSVINLNVAPNYEPTIVMNQTSYDTVSKWKDKNGRYLTHELPDSQAKTFLGFDVVVVPNKLLEGNKMIVGDFEEAITFFDRSRYEVAYDMFENFGLGLMLAIRFDVQVVDTDALVVIDLDGAEA